MALHDIVFTGLTGKTAKMVLFRSIVRPEQGHLRLLGRGSVESKTAISSLGMTPTSGKLQEI